MKVAPLRPLCQSPSRQRAGLPKGALLSLWPASRARRRAHASLFHHQDTRRQAESAADNCSTPRSPAPFKHPLHRIIRHAHRSALSRRHMLMASLGRDARYPGAEDKQRVLPGSMRAQSTCIRPLGEASLRLRNRRFRRVVNPVHDCFAMKRAHIGLVSLRVPVK